VTGDGAEELIYATQAGNELGVLKARPDDDAMRQSGWRDHVIDGGNDRAWWWLDGRFYDLNGNGAETDFFVSSRSYGGSDLGVWQVLQARPGDLSSYRVRRIYEGNALQIDTGYFFSSDRDRRPDVVMVNKPEKQVYLLDGRRGYEVTRVPIDGSCWNVKIIPALRGDDGRDGFVVVAAESPSLFWTFRWRDGAYELRRAMPYPGNYGHPMDGTFTLAELDGEGEPECVVPDSSGSEHAKGLSYLDWDPAATPRDADDPAAGVELGER